MSTQQDRLLGFLHTVKEFSQTRQYSGVMPKRVVKTCEDAVIDEAFSEGFVVRYSSKDAAGGRIEGLVLSTKGEEALQAGLKDA